MQNETNSTTIFGFIFSYPGRVFYRMYKWTIHWSRTRHSKYALFLISFAESSFFPIPPDVLMIPMVVAERPKWWRLALITTIGSISGAVLGYYIGYGLYESIGKPIVDFYHLQQQMSVVGAKYGQNAFLTVFTAAFTPIPFKVFTIAGGVFKISILELIVGAAIGRSLRFFIIAYMLKLFGNRIEDTIEKNFNILSILFFILLIGGYILVKYLV